MSKDIRIANNRKEAENNKEYLDLTDEIMEEIYFLIKNNIDKYPLVWYLLEDYYEDNVINFNSLLDLNKEINDIIKEILNGYSKDTLKFFKLFQILSDNAIKRRSSLYFLAD